MGELVLAGHLVCHSDCRLKDVLRNPGRPMGFQLGNLIRIREELAQEKFCSCNWDSYYALAGGSVCREL